MNNKKIAWESFHNNLCSTERVHCFRQEACRFGAEPGGQVTVLGMAPCPTPGSRGHHCAQGPPGTLISAVINENPQQTGALGAWLDVTLKAEKVEALASTRFRARCDWRKYRKAVAKTVFLPTGKEKDSTEIRRVCAWQESTQPCSWETFWES